jgi:phage-related protein
MAANTLVKTAMLKITADDGDTESKLDRISAKADELAAKHPDLRVRIDTAAATAKLAVLKKELKDTEQAADKGGGRFAALKGALNDLTLGLSGGVGEMSMFQKLMWGLNIATGLGEPLVAGLTVAVGGLSAGLVAGGLGLGAFGLVAKAAYSQVSTAVSAYGQAMNTTGKAQQKYLAQADAAMTALTPRQRAFARSIESIQAAWQGFVARNTGGVTGVLDQGMGLLPKIFAALQPFLGPTEHALHGIIADASHGLASSGFKSWISQFSSASGPMISDLGHAIGHIVVGIGGVLRAFLPMARTMMGGLDSITAKFAAWGTSLTGHSGFQSLMAMFKSETPLAVGTLNNLASIIKTVVSEMTGMNTVSNSRALLEMAMPVTKLAAALLHAHPGLVELVLYLKLGFGAAGKLKTAITGTASAFNDLKQAKQNIRNFVAGFSDAKKAADESTGAFGTWGGKLSSVLSGAKSQITSLLVRMGLMKAATEENTVATEEQTVATEAQAGATEADAAAQTAADVAMDANPIGAVIFAITALIAVIVLLVTHWRDVKQWALDAFHAVVGAAEAAWNWIKDHWKLLLVILTGPIGVAVIWIVDHWHQITDVVGEAIDWVKGHWQLLVGILTGPIGIAVLWIIDHWHMIVTGAEQMANDVTDFFRSLPGRILAALGDLASLLYNAGRNVISGLINGVTSMVGSLGSVMGSIAHKVAGFFGLSPAVEGPLSGGGAPEIRGAHFADALASGMASHTGRVAAAAGRLAGAAGLAAGSGAATAGGGHGRGLELTVRAESSDPFMRELLRSLRFEIREIGGAGPNSVQLALGRPA